MRSIVSHAEQVGRFCLEAARRFAEDGGHLTAKE
jgi:hypothetical protein